MPTLFVSSRVPAGSSSSLIKKIVKTLQNESPEHRNTVIFSNQSTSEFLENLESVSSCDVYIAVVDNTWALSKTSCQEFVAASTSLNKTGYPKIISMTLDTCDWINDTLFPEAHVIITKFPCVNRLSCLNDKDFLKKVWNVVKAALDDDSYIGVTDKILAELLTCDICHDHFTDPRLLGCGHSFCRDCVKSWRDQRLPVRTDFICPNCRMVCVIEVEELPMDFRANKALQMVKKNGRRLTSSSSHFENVLEQMPTEEAPFDVQTWLESSKLPETFKETVRANEVQTISQLLLLNTTCPTFLNTEEVKIVDKELAELCITSNYLQSLTPKAEKWLFLALLFDDSFLYSGCTNIEMVKFWSSLSKQQFTHTTNSIVSLATEMERDGISSAVGKCKKFELVSVILTEAGCFKHATYFAKDAVLLADSKERETELKVLLVYATHMSINDGRCTGEKDFSAVQDLVEMCDDIRACKEHISPNKLCKVLFVKGFNCDQLLLTVTDDERKGDTLFQLGRDTLDEAIRLAMTLDDKSLVIEPLMAKGCLISSYEPDNHNGLYFLVSAYKRCQSVYGEYTILTSRLYHNLGVEIEACGMEENAYECFRRAWLICLHLLGPFHPRTKHQANVMNVFAESPLARGDTIPFRGEVAGSCDENYQKRIAFIASLIPENSSLNDIDL